MPTPNLIGIAAGDPRLVALFCDKVLPLHSSLTIPHQIRLDDFRETIETAALPGLAETTDTLVQEVFAAPLDRWVEDDMAAKLIRRFENTRAAILHAHLSKRGLRSVPFLTAEGTFDGVVESGDDLALEVQLCQVPIIDADALTWEHVLQLRKDPDFTKKLRNFRLLLNEDYQGKQIGYVTDSLLKKIDEYEEACKTNGVRLALSSFQQLLDSKSLLGSLGLVTAGVLLGTPAAVALSSIGAGVIEIGKFTVHFLQKKIELREKSTNDGIAYLMDIRKALGASGGKA